MTVQCCKCKRIQTADGWTVTHDHIDGPVSHTYCPVCHQDTMMEHFAFQASQALEPAARYVSSLLEYRRMALVSA